MTLVESQHRLALEQLRRAAGRPVSLAELRAAGLNFPAAVISELELNGHVIERLNEHGRLVGVRLVEPEGRAGGVRRRGSDERLAWLIVIATIPVGLTGLAMEHTFRTIFAKPLAASIFLVVNGLILLAGDRARRRAEAVTTAAGRPRVPECRSRAARSISTRRWLCSTPRVAARAPPRNSPKRMDRMYVSLDFRIATAYLSAYCRFSRCCLGSAAQA